MRTPGEPRRGRWTRSKNAAWKDGPSPHSYQRQKAYSQGRSSPWVLSLPRRRTYICNVAPTPSNGKRLFATSKAKLHPNEMILVYRAAEFANHFFSRHWLRISKVAGVMALSVTSMNPIVLPSGPEILFRATSTFGSAMKFSSSMRAPLVDSKVPFQ